MLKDLYNRFFPIPQFLAMPSFGLDISDESIKYIELLRVKDGIKLGHYGEVRIPAGIIESGKIKDQRGVERILLSLKKKEGMKSVRVSLPEEQIYLFNLNLNKSGLESIREGIELSLEEYIPIPAQEVIFDYDILSEDNQNLKLQVGAISKNTIEEYLSVFKDAGIDALSFELEADPLARCVIKKEDSSTYMIVDYGKRRTGIFIVSKGVVLFTSTLDVGGATLTGLIEKDLNISNKEAEKKKLENGLRNDEPNKEIFLALLKGVSLLEGDIMKHLAYWNTHKNEEGKDRAQIEKIILCGGSANLISLADYLSAGLKIKVELANVWLNITDTNKNIAELSLEVSLSFAPAIGLALGNFEYD
ncbi:MAG: pilus assembly protein PilM [Patescibacteria group bacterium]